MKISIKFTLIFLIFIWFMYVGIAEENITDNATLDQEALKEEAERKYELAVKRYYEIMKIGVGRGGGGFRDRVYLDIERAREEIVNGNYAKSIEYSENAIETADRMIKNAGSTIHIPIIGEIRRQLVFMFFMLVVGVFVLYLIVKDNLRKREKERYYKQLPSKAILKKPKLLRRFAEDENSEIRVKVSEISKENFDELSIKLREELISILAEDNIWEIRRNISGIMIEKFSSLPKGLRENLLRKFIDDDKERIRYNASDIIKENFDNIPKKLREESLEKLSADKDADVRLNASKTIKWHIEHIPQDMKFTFLKNFINDEYWRVRCDGAEIIRKDFKNIPKKLREDLTRKLINDPKSDVRTKARKILSKNFNDISDDLKKYELNDLQKLL